MEEIASGGSGSGGGSERIQIGEAEGPHYESSPGALPVEKMAAFCADGVSSGSSGSGQLQQQLQQ